MFNLASGKATILVADDNEMNRELLCDILIGEGYKVICAEDGDAAVAAASLREAFDVFVRLPPDAVLLYVQLGAEDGLSLAAWIRADSQFRSLPVIAVTAHAMVTDHQRVIQAGCNPCVSKPIDFKLLSRHLQRFLSGLACPVKPELRSL